MESRKQWNDILKVFENTHLSSILHTVNVSLQKEGKIKKLSDEQNSRESVAIWAALQEPLQEVNEAKENESENNSCIVCEVVWY